MAGVRTDEEHAAFLEANKDGTAVVKYGASWCLHCQEVFPHFLRLSRRFPSFSYAVAQIDYLKKEAQHVEYTPTFTFYHKGKRVDEIFGSNMEQLHDHMWLHASR
eukprot:evm.model.scf_1545.1 EVM.evm.TU.scf_1545.1   scf_1545:8222-9918(+)